MTLEQELAIARGHIDRQIAALRAREAEQKRARLQKLRDDLLAGKLARQFGDCNCDAHLTAILQMSDEVVNCTRVEDAKEDSKALEPVDRSAGGSDFALRWQRT